MVPNLVILLVSKSDHLQPFHFVVQIKTKLVNKFPSVPPSGVVSSSYLDNLFCQTVRTFRNLLLFQYCPKVAKSDFIVLRIGNRSDWRLAFLVLFKRAYIIPVVLTVDKKGRQRVFIEIKGVRRRRINHFLFLLLRKRSV